MPSVYPGSLQHPGFCDAPCPLLVNDVRVIIRDRLGEVEGAVELEADKRGLPSRYDSSRSGKEAGHGVIPGFKRADLALSSLGRRGDARGLHLRHAAVANHNVVHLIVPQAPVTHDDAVALDPSLAPLAFGSPDP